MLTETLADTKEAYDMHYVRFKTLYHYFLLDSHFHDPHSAAPEEHADACLSTFTKAKLAVKMNQVFKFTASLG